MGYRNKLELRPNVESNTFLMELIGNGRCWHFDAWIYLINDDAFYLMTQTRAGGRDVLQTNVYKLHLGATQPLQYAWPLPDGEKRLVTLQDRGLSGAVRDKLNAIHWSHIRPMLARRPDAYTSTSAAFHYIRAPSIDPIEGYTNFFRYGT